MPQILTHISTEYVGDTLADPYLIAEVLAPHLNAREVLPIVLFLHDQGYEHAAMHLLAAWEAHDEDAPSNCRTVPSPTTTTAPISPQLGG